LNESQNKYFVGMPEELDVEELSETRRSAAEYMDEEDDFLSTAGDSRRRPSDPGAVHSRSSGTIGAQDLATLKLRFPRLKEFSDEFLRARTMEELLKIESTSMKLKDAERRGDVEDKLSTNKQNLEANAIWVERGRDNRWSTLHSARFLAGAACSTKKLWLGARAAMGLQFVGIPQNFTSRHVVSVERSGDYCEISSSAILHHLPNLYCQVNQLEKNFLSINHVIIKN
jgi:hypothetical protein